MKRSRLTLILLSVVVLVGSGILWQRSNGRDAKPRLVAQVEARTSQPSEQVRDERLGFQPMGATSKANAPRMELPPQDVPLAAVLPDLAREARAGDVGAMCRLAFELDRCTRKLQSERRTVTRQEELLAEPDLENEASHVQFLARSVAKVEQTELICAGVEIPSDLEAWRLLRDAARAGHVPSMLRFVRNFPVNHQELLQHLDLLAVYRDEAPGFLRRAGASGDPQGALAMLWALQGQSGSVMPWFEPVQKDPVQALAYALALRDVADENGKVSLGRIEAKLRLKLATEDERKAERQSQGLAARLAPSRGMGMSMWPGGGSKSAEDCSRP